MTQQVQKAAPTPKASTIDEKQAGITLMLKSLILFGLTQKLGWILGLIIFILLQKMFDKAIYYLLGYESLSTMDYIFLYDKPISRANIIAATVFTRFESEKVREQFKKKAFPFDRMRQRIKSVFGQNYWETIPNTEFNQMSDSLIIDLKGEQEIKNEEELANFMSKNQQIRDPWDKPQWRLYLQQNYKQNQSLMIFKIHHVMNDGYGIISFLSNLVDEFDDRLLPPMKYYSFLDKIVMYMTVPYHFLTISLGFIFERTDRNPIANGKPLTGLRHCTIAKEYSLAQIKEKCREFKITLNDILITSFSLTMKQYFLSKGDEKTNNILTMIPVNIRQRPKTPKDFEFNNQFMIFPIRVDLTTDFKYGFQMIHRNFDKLRTSFATIGLFYLIKIVTSFPYPLAQLIVDTLGKKPTLFISNVACPTIPYKVAGSESIKMLSLIPGSGDVSGGFLIMSHRDVLQLTFTADESRCSDTKEIIRLLEKNLDQILASKNE